MAGQVELPPIVIEITADSTAFIKALAADKALLADFAKEKTNTQLGADTVPLVADLAKGKVLVDLWAEQQLQLPLGIDQPALMASLAKARVVVQAAAEQGTLFDMPVVPKIDRPALELIQEQYHEIIQEQTLFDEIVPKPNIPALVLIQEQYQEVIKQQTLFDEIVPKVNLETLASELDAIKAIVAHDPIKAELSFGLPVLPAVLEKLLSGESTGGHSGGISGIFNNHITGGWMKSLGVPANIASGLAPALPVVISLAANLFAAAAGMTALAVAAGPTAYAIVGGVSAINTANDALAVATPGTAAWQTAVSNLGTTWAGITPTIQSAVTKILGFFGGQSKIGAQAGQWLVGLIDRLGGATGKMSNIFMPLVIATENALNKVIGSFTHALGSGKFAHFIRSLSKMVGPAIGGLSSIASSIFKIVAALGKMGVGGEGFKLLASAFKTLATVASSGVLLSLAQGIVLFDRGLVTLVNIGVQAVNVIAKFLLNIPLIGPPLKLAAGALFTLSAAAWVMKSKFVASMQAAVVSAVTGARDAMVAFAGMVFGEEAVTGATTAMKIAMVAASTTGILIVAAGIYELIHHFGALHGLMIAGAAAVGILTVAFIALDAVPVVALVVGIAVAVAGLVAGIVDLVRHWRSAMNTLKAVASPVAAVLTGHFQVLHGAIHHVANAARDVWHFFFGGSNAATTVRHVSAAVAKLNASLAHQHKVQEAAAAAARQYANALNGVYPTTGKVTQATQTLITAEEQIGPAIAKQATFFGTFSQGATQTYKQMIANLKKQNVTLGTEMQAARTLIKRGMSPAAVQALAAEMPQDLVLMSHASVAHIKNMSTQFNSLLRTAAIVGGKNGFSLATKVVAGLKSALPQTRAWAKQMAAAMHINTKLVATHTTASLKASFKGTPFVMKGVGTALMFGLSSGVKSGTPNATKATAAAAKKITDTAKHALGVKSPSTVFATIGQEIVAGLAQGMTRNVPLATKASHGLSDRVVTSIDQTLPKFKVAGEDIGKAVASGIMAIEGQIGAALSVSIEAAVTQAVRRATSTIVSQAQAQVLTSVRAGAGSVYG